MQPVILRKINYHFNKWTICYWVFLNGAKQITTFNQTLYCVSNDWPIFFDSASIGEIRLVVALEDAARLGTKFKIESAGNQNLIIKWQRLKFEGLTSEGHSSKLNH